MRRIGPRGMTAGLAIGLAVAMGAAPPDTQSQPATYSAAAIRGWVVDAETRAPLGGVHVVAQWILQTGMLHGRTVERLHILETVTDASGEYRLPGWGPKARPPLSRLETSDPLLTFFRPGYRPLDRSNSDPHDRPLRTSRWDGKTIALEPFRGTPDEWARRLWSVQNVLGWGQLAEGSTGAPTDLWRHYPEVVLAVLRERRALPDALRPLVWDLSGWGITEEDVTGALRMRRPAP